MFSPDELPCTGANGRDATHARTRLQQIAQFDFACCVVGAWAHAQRVSYYTNGILRLIAIMPGAG